MDVPKELLDRISLLESALKAVNRADNPYQGIKRIIRLKTSSVENCEVCGKPLGGLQNGVNHYLKHHDFSILFIGSEGCSDMTQGEIDQQMVVVLGTKQELTRTSQTPSPIEESKKVRYDEKAGLALQDAVQKVAEHMRVESTCGVTEKPKDDGRLPF